MPAKKAAASTAKKDAKVNGVSKPLTTTSAKSSKSSPKATKTAAKASITADKATTKTNKRKADNEAQPSETQANGAKRARTLTASPKVSEEPEVQKSLPTRKKAATKPPAAKRLKTKAVLNHAPKEELNVYVFGDGTNGELGLGTGKNCAEVKRPRLNPHLDAQRVGVVSISVGGMHTAVLTHNNKILTWGVNDQGALGRDTTWDGGLRDIDEDNSDSESDSDTGNNLNPKESTPGELDVSHLAHGITWTQLACSDSATFALTEDGLVYGCGTFRSNEGIFGFAPNVLIQRSFIQIQGLKNITKLAAGANHILALDKSGAVFAWGSGQQNQLGRRILERFLKNSLVPQQFGLPRNAMVNIGAGAYHSFAMHKNGDVYSWGLNSFGETGITQDFEAEGESDVHHPTVIQALEGFGKVTEIEGGSHHTIALTDDGEVLVWGRLDGYQLGLNLSTIPDDRVVRDSAGRARILKVPTQVPNINGAAVCASSDHSIAISKDGKAYAWGFSTSYQTGLGTSDDVEVATLIDNTAIRGKKLIWAGAGGQFSVIAGLASAEPQVNGVNGHM